MDIAQRAMEVSEAKRMRIVFIEAIDRAIATRIFLFHQPELVHEISR